VTSRGQGACTREHLVDGAVVDASLWLLAVLLRNQPEKRELSVQLLRVRLVKEVNLLVPPGALHVHTVDEATIRRWLVDGRWSCVIADLEVEGKLIDSDLVLTSEVLQRTREEGLWEEESRDPESVWSTSINPLGQEVDSLV